MFMDDVTAFTEIFFPDRPFEFLSVGSSSPIVFDFITVSELNLGKMRNKSD